MNCGLLKRLKFVDWGVVESAMLKKFPKSVSSSHISWDVWEMFVL